MTGTCYTNDEHDFQKLLEYAEYVAEDEKYFKMMGHLREDKIENKKEKDNGTENNQDR